MGRFILVELAPDLERFGTTHDVAMICLRHVPGVLTTCDLSAIGLDTLNTILLPDEQCYHPKHKPRGDRNNIRRYWKSIRQPHLPEAG